jgi:hypothetical protein
MGFIELQRSEGIATLTLRRGMKDEELCGMSQVFILHPS